MEAHHISTKSSLHLLAALAVFVLVMSIGIYQYGTYRTIYTSQEQQRIANITNAQALLLDARLGNALNATFLLAQEVRRTRGEVPDFDTLAERLISSHGGITNLQLAPEGIVKRIHPLTGHEKALGHNLLRDDKRSTSARIAVDTGLITLAGPFKLVQGGVAVVGRNPVFLEQDGQLHFWGFASALILIDDLIAETDIPRLQKAGYVFQLSHTSPETMLEDRFPDEPIPPGYISYSASFSVPNDTWTLTLAVQPPQPAISEGIYNLVWGIFSLLLGIATYKLLRWPLVLTEIVKARTQELESANLRYKQLSETDPVTKIPNRRAYEQRISAEISAARRASQALSLLIADIDYFKNFNDMHGHDAGDMALRRVAEEIIDTLPRRTDFAARYGGEEFAVILPSTDAQGAYYVAERIRTRVKSLRIKHNFPDSIGVITVSIGVAALHGSALNEPDLLRHADTAMYAAKSAGKNCSVVYETDQMSNGVETYKSTQPSEHTDSGPQRTSLT